MEQTALLRALQHILIQALNALVARLTNALITVARTRWAEDFKFYLWSVVSKLKMLL